MLKLRGYNSSVKHKTTISHHMMLFVLCLLLLATSAIDARRSRIDVKASGGGGSSTVNAAALKTAIASNSNASSDKLATTTAGGEEAPPALGAGAGAGVGAGVAEQASTAKLVQIPVQQPPSATATATASKLLASSSPSTITSANDSGATIASAEDDNDNNNVKSEALKHDQSLKTKNSATQAETKNVIGSSSTLNAEDDANANGNKEKEENFNSAISSASASASASSSSSENEQKSSQPQPAVEGQLSLEEKQIPSSSDTDTFEKSMISANAAGLYDAESDPTDTEEQQEIVNNNNINDNNNNVNNNLGGFDECDSDMLGYEIITGYVFSAPGKLLDSLPGTLMLTDCLEACSSNETCHAVNYETGLCVLFSANADKLPGALTKSQFPVFTIYAQKTCLGVRPCARAWCVDRVQNYKLNGHSKRTVPVTSRRDCLELCLGETEFTCRSANYYRSANTCELSEMDRITLAGSSGAFQVYDGIDYLENNCAEEPNKLCEFKRLSGRILKTVDSVYQDVGSIDECRELCLNSPYRCHSYDYGDTGDMVCRLSHHSRATLSDVQDPYLDVPEAATYELSSCYNVTVECGAGDMIARIRTSKLFDGKVYAKGAPKSCSVDVKSALDFELRMRYQDLECNVKQSGSGRYMNDVVIQHHDMIVTSSDLGLAVTCQYDLTNKSVTNDVDLGVKGDIEPALSEEVIVDSPNVIMKITSRDGSDIMRSAEVGDPLALKFEILDEQSPYEIFVRELVAMDGGDNAEITLIDSNGCPTDHFIMGPIYKSSLSGKILLSHFDAFKFPSSEVVQFRALVTPCMPTCDPIQCDQEDFSGETKSLLSYGRRRRSINGSATSTSTSTTDNSKSSKSYSSKTYSLNSYKNRHERSRREVTTANGGATTSTSNSKPTTTAPEDMLLVQSIQITDKFGFDKQQQLKKSSSGYDSSETVFISSDTAAAAQAQGFCVNAIGLIVAATVFLLAQLAVISIWTYLYQRRRKQRSYSNEIRSNHGNSNYGGGAHTSSGSGSSSSSGSSTMVSQLPSTRNESLCKLYDSGFAGRHGRQF